MSDPYVILGVSRNATDEQIKAAYRELAKKYHPDHYVGSPLSDLAAEKMKEINEAYDRIIEERKRGANVNNGYAHGQYGNQNYNSNYIDVRNLILSGRLIEAEQILDGVLPESRDAEWFFLKGTVQFRKGFLDMAYRNITTACNLDPNNMEYRSAFDQVNAQRNGGSYNSYNTNSSGSSCNACDVCSALMCADCCCECMGGDLIRCC